jgi:hypothetical protein
LTQMKLRKTVNKDDKINVINQSLMDPFPSLEKKSSQPPTNSSLTKTMGMVFQLYLAPSYFLFWAPSGVSVSTY